MKKAGALYRARTVHLWTTLRPQGLALNEKQIPRFVENNGNASSKWNAWNELSCAQGLARYQAALRPDMKCTIHSKAHSNHAATPILGYRFVERTTRARQVAVAAIVCALPRAK
jgi:hypothetical protein